MLVSRCSFHQFHNHGWRKPATVTPKKTACVIAQLHTDVLQQYICAFAHIIVQPTACASIHMVAQSRHSFCAYACTIFAAFGIRIRNVVQSKIALQDGALTLRLVCTDVRRHVVDCREDEAEHALVRHASEQSLAAVPTRWADPLGLVLRDDGPFRPVPAGNGRGPELFHVPP